MIPNFKAHPWHGISVGSEAPDIVNVFVEIVPSEEEIAEKSYDRLHDGVLKFINKTNYDRYMMILKSAGIIDASLIRSDNALNFAYALFILLRDKGVHSNTIETVVRKWLVLSITTAPASAAKGAK